MVGHRSLLDNTIVKSWMVGTRELFLTRLAGVYAMDSFFHIYTWSLADKAISLSRINFLEFRSLSFRRKPLCLQRKGTELQRFVPSP